VILWPAGAALVIVWNVFRDPALDHRVVVLGALVPDVIDLPTGGAGPAHTLLASVAVLVVVMAATRGSRPARRRWLALPIGMLVHLAVDGAWTLTATFWWPILGTALDDPLPALDRPLAVTVGLEAVGLAAVAWFGVRFGLADPGRWGRFWRTGRLVADRAGR